MRAVTNWTCINVVNPDMSHLHLQLEKLAEDDLWKTLNWCASRPALFALYLCLSMECGSVLEGLLRV